MIVKSREYPDPECLLEVCSALGQFRLVLPSWWENNELRNKLSKEHDVKLWRHIELFPTRELIRESNRKLRIYEIDTSNASIEYMIRGPICTVNVNKVSEDLRLEAILIALSMRIETAFAPIFH